MPRARTALAEYRRKRDFSRTREPAGSNAAGPRAPTRPSGLQFVIQKHAASHLHFDVRLELDGVMKSWAVPKGPSLDPAVKRLAMEVEDHPIEYNTFEGIIPQGEYGGGTVMLWDRGTYTADSAVDGDDAGAMRRGHAAGELKFTLNGERLQGSWTLIRMRRRDAGSSKPQWLLIKHRDHAARDGSDIVAETMTSVTTGRTMDEIAHKKKRPAKKPASTPRRTRQAAAAGEPPSTRQRRSARVRRLEPMYATIGTAVPESEGWTFEPKYDGIRVLAYVTPGAARLITRNGNDKTKQFPEIVAALQALGQKVGHELVVDGEIIAVVEGEIARFQALQDRMHVKDVNTIADFARRQPASIALFDILVDGKDVLLREPWAERRKRLERVLRRRTNQRLHISPSVPGDGEEMLERARRDGLEGVIAKRTDSMYEPGARSRAWLKLKVEHRQELVVGGWTEPRNTREYIGALLLGYFDGHRFVYAGHTGGGFTRQGLKHMYARLAPLERKTSPFEDPPRTNERAHWTRPEVVVEVKFSEWTADGKLRQPIFLGVRDDKPAREVGREPESVQEKRSGKLRTRRVTAGAAIKRAKAKTGTKRARAKRSATTRKTALVSTAPVVRQLEELEQSGKDATLSLDGVELSISSLGKVFFPRDRITKGDVMRYYASVADAIVPVMQDRPLVLKRFPNGIDGESFYQQKAPDRVPPGVRVETIRNERGVKQRRVIGGNLATLLYTVQLGAISVDPWHSRVPNLEETDYTILDLDPGPKATFARVVEVAQLVHEELEELGLFSIAKTSGSSGMHVVLPLEPGVSDETALLAAQIIATRVAARAPSIATIERSVGARAPASIYVDYLQNIRAKTVAAAYSVRARPGATVSTPLEWTEVGDKLDPRDFTIESVPPRLQRTGDIWAREMKNRNPIRALLETGTGKPKSRR
ncbi:MAG: DNA ligase D [Gemmatimonadota bacterium]|nr:DNA ligase D [Gemmatimonadota bacterium]